MTNDPFLNAKYLTEEMLREQWVFDLKFSEMVIQSWPFLFENLNDFLFQFSADEHKNSKEYDISYNEGPFSKIDNIIYVKNRETNQRYIVTDISYDTLLLTAIENYINSYKSFSVGNYQFMTFKLLEFLNNMKNPDDLLTRIKNSSFFQDVGPLTLIQPCILFFEHVSYTDLDEYLDSDSLILKKKFFNMLNLFLTKLLVKTNITNPSKQANDLAESIRETGNVDQIIQYFIKLESKYRSLKS